MDAAKLIGKIKHFANYSHEIVSALMVKKALVEIKYTLSILLQTSVLVKNSFAKKNIL